MDDDQVICYDFKKQMQVGEMQDLTDGAEMTCIETCEWGDGKSHALVCGDRDGDLRVL